MYNQITSNKRRTTVLIVVFFAFILLIGWVLDVTYGSGSGSGGLVLAGIISLAMALTGYYRGDRVALWSAGAKPVAREENPYLHRLVENLCIGSGVPTPAIYVIPDQAINAFATGRDPKHASVAVTNGAIEKLENEELEGVIAHELSHVKNYDIRLMTIVVVLVGTIALIADLFLRFHFFGGRGRSDRDRGLHPVFLIIGVVLIVLSPIIAKLIQLAISRKREYLADASGALLTRYPEGLARALEKINIDGRALGRASTATAHLFISNPFGPSGKKFLATLFSTHPPLEDRIKQLRAMGGLIFNV